ncbi:MAG: 2-amino-4-hydroxy-6-hydroxymethyldihydropteridine diphosphokinase [Pseudomonadota bacterium]
MILALGSNLASSAGAPPDTLRASLAELANRGAAIRAVSAYYSTPAFPAGNGPDFVNAAAVIRADWSPQKALAHFHAVEAQFARTRDERWGQRTLDIDLIAAGAVVLPDEATHAHWRTLDLAAQMRRVPDDLILPHPRLQDRAFVLVPLAQIAPNWVHPVLNRSVVQMLNALPQADVDAVKLL